VVSLAEEFSAEEARRAAEFNDELGPAGELPACPGRGGRDAVQPALAKGLEWDAVLRGRAGEGTLPTTYARTPEAVEEERRLLYVGVTRAREWLTLSYAGSRAPGGRQRRPSRFLPVEDGAAGAACRAGAARRRDPDGTRRRVISVPCRVCGAVLNDARTASSAAARPVRPHGRRAVRQAQWSGAS
jgi:DNA helicase-2/ATP-dependent DNA helicase PcrA